MLVLRAEPYSGMARFVKGQKGGPGRPKGQRDAVKMAATELAQNILTSPKYVANLRARADSGKLAPAVEQMLWQYAAGKPPDKLELTGADGGPVAVMFGGRFKPEAAHA